MDARVAAARREEQGKVRLAQLNTRKALDSLAKLRAGLEHVGAGTMMPAQLAGLLARLDTATKELGGVPPSSP